MKKLMINFMSLGIIMFAFSSFAPIVKAEKGSILSCTYQVQACDNTGDGKPDIFLAANGFGPAPLPSNFNANLYTVTPNGCEIISIPISCPPSGGGPTGGGGSPTQIQINACDNTGDGQPDIFLEVNGFGPAPLPYNFNPALYTVPINGCEVITITL